MMNDRLRKSLKIGEQTKAKGRLKYCLTTGIAFGLFVGITNSLLFYYLDDQPLTFKSAILNVVITAVLAAIFIWKFNVVYQRETI